MYVFLLVAAPSGVPYMYVLHRCLIRLRLLVCALYVCLTRITHPASAA